MLQICSKILLVLVVTVYVWNSFFLVYLLYNFFNLKFQFFFSVHNLFLPDFKKKKKRFVFHFSLSLVFISSFIIQNITNWFVFHVQWGRTILGGETGGCTFRIGIYWDIGHPPFSRSWLLALTVLHGEERWQTNREVGSTPQHKWAVAISLKKGPVGLVSFKISNLWILYKFFGFPLTFTDSFRNPLAIISSIRKTIFILVVLVEASNVHDHLDYYFKIKEKGKRKKEEENYFLLFFMSHQMYLQVICDLKLWFINENNELFYGVVKFWNYVI